jgi:hypothetical protein
MKLAGLRILPPFAIGRLGSAPEPLDNYVLEDEPGRPLAHRRIVGAPTLRVDEETGEIAGEHVPGSIEFRSDGRIRPVAPFLEAFALTSDDRLEPLTLDLLRRLGLEGARISWRVRVANRKVVRRTGREDDLVSADTGWFGDHGRHELRGHSRNFVSRESFVAFGTARYIRPNERYPGLRLRFTPAAGLIYGPRRPKGRHDPVIPPEREVYDPRKGWAGFGGPDDPPLNETVPPALFAIDPPAPPWLFDNVAVSRGYLDDACDGFVDLRVETPDGREMVASARICAAPPVVAPDSLFVRSLADDLEQAIHGPEVPADEPPAVTHARAADIVRRAYETVRFMNVAVMNGNDFDGRPALLLDSMPEEEAADTERAIRPVMAPASVDTLAILALHEQVYAALRGGAAAWFVDLLRRPEEVADFTDHGRRKMPALMCGADNGYLALTHRQIDTIRKAASEAPFRARAAAPPADVPPRAGTGLTPRNRTAQLLYAAAGNPESSRPTTSVANCCPGLEVDFRAVWRRMLEGIVLREHDNLVVEADPGQVDDEGRSLAGHRLLRIRLPGGGAPIVTTTPMLGPASSDPGGRIRLTTEANPSGLAAVEWSNALARMLATHQGQVVLCDFSREPTEALEEVDEAARNFVTRRLRVRRFFEEDSALISRALADAGELTQGLCSPWQNDYRECSCYYWASARPDYVNVEETGAGLSAGDNWFQKERTGRYVPDDYADTRLVLYDDLFADWEKWLRIQVRGRDAPGEAGGGT